MGTSSAAQAYEATRFYDMVRNAWDMVRLGGRTFAVAARPPYSWVGDFVVEANNNFRRCAFPLTISAVIWLIGFGVLNFGEIVGILGATDRDAGGVYVGYVREVATWVTLMILAGVAGSGLAADLGARKIREELDALAVLGVDTTRKLIVPRVLAMVYCAVILGLIGLLIPIMTNYLLYPSFQEFAPAVYRHSWYLFIEPLDLIGSMVKHALIGVFLGVVACQKGLATKGGAEGVGRAVTQTVIVSFFGLWLFNSVYNIGFLTLFPDLSIAKG